MVVPGSQQVKAAGRAEGLDQVFIDAGFEWREAGCSMCLGMNPDILSPGERCASHLEPQLRGPAGHGRPHPPGQPGDGRRRRDRRPLRRHPRLEDGGTKPWSPFTTHTGKVAAALPRRRRHRPDHPGSYLKRIERTGFGAVPLRLRWRQAIRTSCSTSTAYRRRQRPGRRPTTSAAARRASTRRGRCSRLRLQGDHRAVVRRHLPQQLRPRSACCWSELPEEQCEQLSRRAEGEPGLRADHRPGEPDVVRRPRHSTYTFEIDPFRKHCLLNGLDDIGLTLDHEQDITAFEATRPAWLPTTTTPTSSSPSAPGNRSRGALIGTGRPRT